ncbi:MAG: hypothetical protein ACK5O2_12665 [Microthrixaceae bacterium]
MDTSAELNTGVAPEVLFAEVERLDHYDEWLDIVSQVQPASPDGDDPGPAWSVDLRASIGPLRRSKRLRMVRDRHEAPHLVRFTRRELDGRDHSDWTLVAEIRPSRDGADLLMSLHYGGSLWIPLMERMLREEIKASRPRLAKRLGA